jgi:hypothetical protein
MVLFYFILFFSSPLLSLAANICTIVRDLFSNTRADALCFEVYSDIYRISCLGMQ